MRGCGGLWGIVEDGGESWEPRGNARVMSHDVISWPAETWKMLRALFVSKREITKLLSQYSSVIVSVDIIKWIMVLSLHTSEFVVIKKRCLLTMS